MRKVKTNLTPMSNPSDFMRSQSRAKRASSFHAKKAYQAGHALGIKDRRQGNEAKGDRFLLDEGKRRFPQLAPYEQEVFRSGYNHGYFEKLSGPKGSLPNPKGGSKWYVRMKSDGRPIGPAAGFKTKAQAEWFAGSNGILDQVVIKREYTSEPRRNPAADADSAFESFHGEPSSETVIIEDEIHEHEHLWTCGRLMQICVNTQTGMYLELDWEGRPDGEIPYLACSEDGRQLYIEGGDQELDLEAISMDTDRWLKDRMVIGEFAPKERGREYNITYRTKKDFDGFEETDYQHELGESSKELRNPAAPFLEYEPRNKKLYITGGQYIIKKPMFGTSPGIEN